MMYKAWGQRYEHSIHLVNRSMCTNDTSADIQSASQGMLTDGQYTLGVYIAQI